VTSPCFVALGDLHLDTHIWRAYGSIAGDSEMGLTSLVDLAIELFVPLVLLGDLFDLAKPSPEVVDIFRTQMDRCQEESVPVYCIQGNHDLRYPLPWYTAVHNHPRHIGDGKMVEIKGLTCVGFDYARKLQIQERLSELSGREEKPQVLFLHQALDKALRFETAWNCALEWIPEGIPLTLVGDIHMEWEAKVRDGQMAYYTGPMHACDIGQRGPKTAMVVYDDLTVSRRLIAYREIGSFKLTTPEEVRELERWCEQVLSQDNELPPVAQVHFTPDHADEMGRIKAERDGRVIFMDRAVDAPGMLELDLEEDRTGVDQTISVEEHLGTLIDPEKEPGAHQLTLDLLDDSNSIPDVLREARTAFTKQEG